MPITADKVREFAARGEGSALDFKRDDYDWSPTARKASNAELAKDLMAMANILGPGASPAYILIGVENDGLIVGMPPMSHVDDASLHQKVGGLLNRTPTFQYGPVDVGGLSVGVYEIRPSPRPFFPLRDGGASLRKHVAMYRDGTTTEPASPAMILDWSREDDPVGHQLRTLELRRLEAESKKLDAEARIHGHFAHDKFDADGERALVYLGIENRGRSGFFVVNFSWTVGWNAKFRDALLKAGVAEPIADYVPPHESMIVNAGIIPAGATWRHTFRWTREAAIKHLRDAGISVHGFDWSWADLHFAAIVEGELGGRSSLIYSIRQ